MNCLDLSGRSSANEAAILNVLMYLPFMSDDNTPLYKIIEKLSKKYNDLEPDEQRQFKVLKQAVDNNPILANMIIGNQSIGMTNPSYEEGGLNACTFTDSNGNVFVVYRGTGAGEWLDNGYGVSGLVTETRQQTEAKEYFDRVVNENHYDDKFTNIIVCGHSKGGNKAQFTTINSKYSYLISNCYSFDGQGMSPEAIEKFKDRLGEEEYKRVVNKIYGIYADNDYVSPLGHSVIPKEHRYYFESQLVKTSEDIIKYHYADNYLNKDGTFSNLTECGNLSKLNERFTDFGYSPIGYLKIYVFPMEGRYCEI